MDNIEPENLFSGLSHIFQFIYKNIKMLDFKEESPYEYYITLLEKEKIKFYYLIKLLKNLNLFGRI